MEAVNTGYSMLNIGQARDLLEKLNEVYSPFATCYVVVPLPDGQNKPEDVSACLNEIKEMGYYCYLRSCEFGDEIVVTHHNEPQWEKVG